MRRKTLLWTTFFIIISISFSGCDLFFPEFYEFQTKEYVVTKQFDFVYSIQESKTFIEAQKITADQIIDAIDPYSSLFFVTGERFRDRKIKDIVINGGTLSYNVNQTNQADKLEAIILASDDTKDDVIVAKKKTLGLDLFSVIGTKAVLAADGVNFLRGSLKDHVNRLNNDGISFLMSGNPLPNGKLADLELTVSLNVQVVYEVCEKLPLGVGDKLCN